MRVSIWRQFSSNHSNSFTVIGTFKTPEIAYTVADRLRTILVEIAQWYEADPEWAANYQELGLLSPPEVEYSEQYGIAWGQNQSTGLSTANARRIVSL